MLRLADAYTELGAIDRACSLVEELMASSLATEDRAAVARERLIPLYRRSRRARELVALLEVEASRSAGPAAASLLIEAADASVAELDDPEGALRLLERAVEREPESQGARPRMVAILERLGRTDEVAAVLSAHLSVHSHGRWPELAPLRQRLAETLAAQHRPHEALDELRRATKVFPTDAGLLVALGRSELAAGDLANAERALRSALLADHRAGEHRTPIPRVQIHVELAEISLQRDDTTRAANLLESAFDAAIEQGDDVHLLEPALRRAGLHDLLARALEWRIAREQDAVARGLALRELATMWREHLGAAPELGERIRARALLEMRNTGGAEACAALCAVFTSLDDDAMFLDVVERHLESLARMTLDEERTRARVAVARLLLDREAYVGRAIDLLSAMVSEDPSDDEAALGLVDALVAAGRTLEAEHELETLVERSPDHPGALERLARSASASGDWARAAGVLENLIRTLDAPPAEVILAFVDACERAALPEGAVAVLEQAVRRMPNDEVLALRLESICETTRSWRRLDELLVARAERTADPSEKSRLFLRAVVLRIEKLGAPERALPLLEEARSASPDSVEVLLASARIHASIGKPMVGIELLEKVADDAGSKKSPVFAEVNLELAKSHLAADELVEALDRLKAGFAISMRHPELSLLLGLVAIDLGEDQTAERALLSLTMLAVGRTPDERTSDRRTAYTHLARIAQTRGDHEKARTWAAKAAAEGRHTDVMSRAS
jgi:tetratricopeptide (TPR) repeat protein